MIASIASGSFIGPYEIRGFLGAGALGVVYRAYQESLEREIALKLLSPALVVDSELVDRFRREARTAASLQHPHIVRIYDTGAAESYHYIAMELLHGQTLNQLPLPMEPPQASDLIRQLCEALAYAHGRGVVHRDLKPENVMVDATGHLTLTDFGIARVAGQARATVGGGVIGTPEFMSPEQARGETADFRSDVYSLGLLFYFLLVGSSPFQSENALAAMYRQLHEPLPALPEAIPGPLRGWMEGCTGKDPADRYSSGVEALNGLKEAIRASPVAPGAAPPTAARNPLERVLSGELSLEQALQIYGEREDEIRSAFQRNVTALSLDIVRSTQLKAPGQTILTSFTFAALRKQIQDSAQRHGALAVSWSGDGLMVLFPNSDLSAAAAKEVLNGLAPFNSSASAIPERVQIRIGIHQGPVLMSDSQRLGEVTSLTLDLAGRLQKAAAPDTALLSGMTWAQLSQQDEWQPYPAVPGITGAMYGWSPNGAALLPGLQAPPVHAAAQTLQKAASPMSGPSAMDLRAVSSTPSLPVRRTGISTVLPAVLWAVLLTNALATIQGPLGVMLWLASMVASVFPVVRGCRPRWAGILLPIVTILGGCLAHDVVSFQSVAVVVWLLTGWIGVSEASERSALREQVALVEQPGNQVWRLPRRARNALLDCVAPESARLGFRPRQLGLRLTPELVVRDAESLSRRTAMLNSLRSSQHPLLRSQVRLGSLHPLAGATLTLRVQAFDRDTNRILAECTLDGNIEDSVGLARDLGARISRQLESHALPAPEKTA